MYSFGSRENIWINMETFINKIIQGNCVDIMKQMPEACIDLVVTSPPYDKLRDYKGYTFNFKEIVRYLYKIIKPNGVVIWVVGDSIVDGGESGTSFRQALFFMKTGFKLFDTMLYEKTGVNFPSKGRYTQIFEYMFVFSRGKPKTFNPIKDVPKLWEGSWGKATRRQKNGTLKEIKIENCGKAKSGRATDGRYGYKQRTNIWKIINGKKFAHTDILAYEHPATFPEALARDHIISWSNPGDIVLDPMCGAGTTCKMAKQLKRNYIGIDISNTYCKLAEQRLKLIGG